MRGLLTSAPAGVLREVTLQGQPHTLARPGRTPARDAARADQGWEEKLEVARQQGYADGLAAAAREQRDAIAAERSREMEEARSKGLEQGLRDAEERVQATCREAAAEIEERMGARATQLRELANSLDVAFTAAAGHLEEDAVALAHRIVCALLGEKAASPETLSAMVSHMLHFGPQQRPFAVHVHPDDHALLSARQSSVPAWQWVPDDRVQLGGVMLVSHRASLDARLETQLAMLHEVLVSQRTKNKVHR